MSNRVTQMLTATGVVAVALAWFVYRGPVTALAGPQEDLTGPYGMSRAWLERKPPYNVATVQEAAGGVSHFPVRLVSQPVYPPTTLVMMAPFAALPWAQALVAWQFTLVVAYLLSILTVARWWRFETHLVPATVFGAGALLFAPAHTGLIVANPGLPSTALAMIATYLALTPGRGRAVCAGVLLGMATALKPQVALPFWIYLCVTRRWLAVAVGTATPLAILAGVVWDLTTLHAAWFTEWRTLVADIEVPWLAGDTVRRFGRLQLAVIVETFVTDRWLIRVIVAALLAVPGVWWVKAVWTRAPEWRATGNVRAEAVAITPLIAMSLLAMYHRPYDAVALLPALGWVVWDVTRHGRKAARAALVAGVALAVFMVLPWVTVLVRLVRTGTIPPGISEHVLFQALVMAHPTWALIAITAAGLWQLARPHRGSDASGAPAHLTVAHTPPVRR